MYLLQCDGGVWSAGDGRLVVVIDVACYTFNPM
jgi:hypothetical protein